MNQWLLVTANEFWEFGIADEEQLEEMEGRRRRDRGKQETSSMLLK